MFFKIGVLKNFSMFAKTPVFESFFNKVGGPEALHFYQKRGSNTGFPVNLAKFLRTAFLWDTFSSLYFYYTFM